MSHSKRSHSSIHVSDYPYFCTIIHSGVLVAKGVEKSQQRINDTRQEILAAFEYYVIKVSPQQHIPHRFGNLLLLLPPILVGAFPICTHYPYIQAIARDLVEDVQLARLFGLANIDSLMSELMLPEDESHPRNTLLING
jgi:hypothetical protein